MIVYIETNFLFELGLGREQQVSCRQLVTWCRGGQVDLRLPSFAIPEMRAAVRRRESTRLDVIRGLESQQSDAARHSTDPSLYESAEKSLRAWTKREGSQLDDLTQEMFALVKFVPLNFEALQTATHLRKVKAVTGDADLFVLASIIRDLDVRKSAGDTAPSLFVTATQTSTRPEITSPLTPATSSSPTPPQWRG